MQRGMLVGSVVVAVGCLLSARPVHAYRPFDGTDADTADFGEFELELAPAQPVREGDTTTLAAPSAVFNLGILHGAEFVIDWVGEKPLNREAGEPGYAITDTDVVFKFLLHEGSLQDKGHGPSIAMESGVLTPDIGGDENGFGATANFIVSQRWDWFIVHLNSEGEFSRGDLDFGWANMLITEFKVSETIWPALEFTWEHEMIDGGATVYSGLLGMIWSVTEGLDLDAAVVAAKDDGENVFEGRLGLTWAFPVWGGENEEQEDDREARE
jgi:hypothetical protein